MSNEKPFVSKRYDSTDCNSNIYIVKWKNIYVKEVEIWKYRNGKMKVNLPKQRKQTKVALVSNPWVLKAEECYEILIFITNQY